MYTLFASTDWCSRGPPPFSLAWLTAAVGGAEISPADISQDERRREDRELEGHENAEWR